jgi:hypothetical protein
MKTWCHLPTIIGRRNALRVAGLLSLCIALITTLLFAHVSHATAGINQTINFQGRLLDTSGGVVPDGKYSIQFKIYQGGDGQTVGTTGTPSGTAAWNEDYIYTGSGTDHRVDVKNGFLSVNLGSLTAFGSNVNWNDDTIWLSMNVGGSNLTCSTFAASPCSSGDGEMLPMKRMTASPYALNSGLLGGKSADNFVQLAQGVQTDASTSTSSIYINKTGSGNLIQFQNAGTDVYTVSQTGDLTFGSNANHTLSVATAGASSNGKTLAIIAGAGGTGNTNGGDLTLQGGAGAGTGVQGQVKIGAGGFVAQTATLQSFTGDANVNGVDSYSTVYINATSSHTGGWTATVPAPTNSYTGRLLYIQVGSIAGSAPDNVINIAPSGGSPFAMNANSVVALVWNASMNAWLNAGSSSSSGSFIQNQNATDQTADFRISGTGQAAHLIADDLNASGAVSHTTLSIGNSGTNTATINIGSTSLATGTQSIVIGNNSTAGVIQNVTLGSASGSSTSSTTTVQSGGSTAINSKTNTTIATNGTTRATFDTSGNLFLGDGTTAASTGAFTIQGSTGGASNNGYALKLQGGTGGSGTGNTGGSVTIQGGVAGGTNANGGNVILQGGTGAGTGVVGQVKLYAGGYETDTIGAYGVSSTIALAEVDNYSSLAISASTTGLTITVPAPTTKYNGRTLYIQLTGSNPITLSPNGGSNSTVNPNTVYALVWNTSINAGAGGWLAASVDSDGFIQNQNAADQTANFRINGVGQATTGFLGPSLDVATAGTLNIGTSATTVATTIQIGSTSLSSGTQNINIGGNTNGGGIQNVDIGSTNTASGGTTTLHSKNNTILTTGSIARLTLDTSGDLFVGDSTTSTGTGTFNIQGSTGAAANTGYALTLQGGTGGSGTGSAGGLLTVRGGNGGGTNGAGGSLSLDAGAPTGTGTRGAIGIGNFNAGSITMGQSASIGTTIGIGSTGLNTGVTQAITIGGNAGGNGTQNVTVGSSSTSGAGSTTIQSKGNTTVATNGTTRATFDTSGNLFVGDGTTSSSTGTFTIQGSTGAASNAGYAVKLQGGTGGSGTGFAGGALTLQGGTAGGTNGTGGDVTLQGGTSTGTGVQGQVKLSTSGFTTATAQNFTTSANITQANIDNFSAIEITENAAAAVTVTVPAPTTKYNGRLLYLQITTISGGATTVIIAPSGGSTITMSANTGATLMWNTTTNGWINAGADSGNNSYIQNQNGSVQTANYKISGVGQANTGFIGPSLDVASAGSLNIGTNATTVATTIQIGSTGLASTTQAIVIGNNSVSTVTQNLTVGSASGGNTASTTTLQSAGSTAVQSKTNTTIVTNGTTRATFDTSGNLFVGDSTTSSSTGTFTMQGSTGAASNVGYGVKIQGGTGGSGTGFAGGALTLQGGTAGGTNANGGDVTLQGGTAAGTGVQGQVKLSTGGFTTATAQNFTANANVTQSNVDNFSSIEITASGGGPWTATVPAPTTKYNGRLLYIQISTIAGASTINIAPNGGTTITMSPSTGVTLVWNTTINAGAGGWLNAGADSGNNSYIQNQNSSVQTANYKISGVGQANTGFIGPSLDVASAGSLNIGTNVTTVATSIQLGSATLSSGTQTITVGGNSSGATQTVVVGSGSGAASGTSTTTIQAKDNVSIATNGTTRATFASGGNNLYVGNASNSGTNATPSGLFTIQATSNSGTGAGEALTIQAGNSGSSANGANLTLSGGTSGNGVSGLVVLTTPTFQNAGTDANCYTGGATVASSCTITAASVNGNSSIIVGFNTSGQTATLPDPGNTTAGRIVYIIGANGSSDFTLSINGGGSVSNLIALRANASATMVWNGIDWTAAGASSSTTLQAAYDNTIQSSGGAELIVSKTSNTNGLTIRDNTGSNSVNGALLSVQSNTAANLFSVNSNVTDYAADPGAEVPLSGTQLTQFPATTWAKQGNASVAVARNTTAANVATGQASVSVTTTANANDGVNNVLTSTLTPGLTYNVSFTALLSSGTFNDLTVDYTKDGSGTTSCATAQQIVTKSWTKISCSFTVPSSGVTSSNAIWIRQATGIVRTFYVDNLSVTSSASQSLVSDGGVDSALGSNWVLNSGATVTRSTANGYDASDSVQVSTNTTTTSGVKNNLSVTPLASVSGGTTYLYRVTAYVQTQVTALTAFTIQYNDGTSTTNCVDYNTQAVATSTTAFTKITCIIQTPVNASPSSPYLLFSQGDTTARNGTVGGNPGTLFIDTASMTIANSTTPNVQIGGGINGGPTTLFTLDKGAGAPIAGDNQNLLGSMYYDTTIGKIQCYQAAGWGSCGSAPDTIVTISPEYTNAVFHGTGVGTLTSDLCSDFLNINDPTNGPQICNTNETYNFYKWTSPQPTTQFYSVYVTYQLPSTFKAFGSGSTSVKGRVDNTTNSTINYQVYKSNSSGLTACGSPVNVAAVSPGVGANVWDPGVATGAADPSTCSFAANNSIVFKITMSSTSTSNAYISNIGFTFSNR